MFKVGDRVRCIRKDIKVDEWTIWTVTRIIPQKEKYCVKREWFTRWHDWCNSINIPNDDWSHINETCYYWVGGNDIELVQRLDKTIAVFCPAERQAKRLMQEIERLWWKWNFWNKPTVTNRWNIYKEQTVYWLNDNKTLQFLDYEYAIRHPEEWTLYSFECALKVLWVSWTTATEYYNLAHDEPFIDAIERIKSVSEKWNAIYTWTQFWELAWIKAPINPIKEAKEYCQWVDTLLNSNKPKKMTTLNTMIWDRFFKKEETKVCELIETSQERFEPIVEMLDYFNAIRAEVNEIIEDIDDDIEENDKAELKKDKKRLESFIKEHLDDKLLEQLLVIAKKMIK